MGEHVILFKSNADTSAALTAYSIATTGAATISRRAGIDNPILARADPVVATTAQARGYVIVYRNDKGTTPEPMLVAPHLNTVGWAAGEAIRSQGALGYVDLNIPLENDNVLACQGTYETASKDQGVLLHLIYGDNKPYSDYDGYPDMWIRAALDNATVDVWSAGDTLAAGANGVDTKKRYALVGVMIEPDDSDGLLALRFSTQSRQDLKPGCVPVEGEYKMLDCIEFNGNETLTVEQFDGVASKASTVYYHLKILGNAI